MSAELTYNKDTNDKVTRVYDDYTTARAAALDNLDQSLSSTESDIRGADSDTLKTLSDQLDAVAAYVDTEVAAIKAKTDNLPTDPADQSAVEAKIDSAEADIRGASSRDLTEVYNLVNTASNPFRQNTYGTVAGTSTAFVDATWVDIYSSGALAKDTMITGITIDITAGTPVAPLYRITQSDGTTKLFPYGASKAIRDNKVDEFQFPLNIPDGSGFKVQVNCTTNNGASATLTELDKIEVG